MWAGVIRVWDERQETYRKLIMRIEDTEKPGCLVRLYDGENVIDEELAEAPQQAVHSAVEMARRYLDDPAITEEALDWLQVE